MTCDVKLIAASISAVNGESVYTFQLRYWRAIHAEVMTHKNPSRNAGSSRAIPVKKVLAQVWKDPAGPIHWGANQAGMQARTELTGWRLAAAKAAWRGSAKTAAFWSWIMMKIGLHKQVANRVTEPYQYINVVFTISGRRLTPFFSLRCHPDAQPEFRDLAYRMAYEVERCTPRLLQPGEWHLPYTLESELHAYGLATCLMVSTARVARVSYTPFDGNAMIEKEVERHDLLVGSEPRHASPTEHQLRCMEDVGPYANFDGFKNYRTFLEQGEVPV